MRLFVYRCWLPSQKGVIFAFIGPMVAIIMVRIKLWLCCVFVMIVIDVYVIIYIIRIYVLHMHVGMVTVCMRASITCTYR